MLPSLLQFYGEMYTKFLKYIYDNFCLESGEKLVMFFLDEGQLRQSKPQVEKPG